MGARACPFRARLSRNVFTIFSFTTLRAASIFPSYTLAVLYDSAFSTRRCLYIDCIQIDLRRRPNTPDSIQISSGLIVTSAREEKARFSRDSHNSRLFSPLSRRLRLPLTSGFRVRASLVGRWLHSRTDIAGSLTQTKSASLNVCSVRVMPVAGLPLPFPPSEKIYDTGIY